jgi:hypothetical protein
MEFKRVFLKALLWNILLILVLLNMSYGDFAFSFHAQHQFYREKQRILQDIQESHPRATLGYFHILYANFFLN